MSAVAAAAFVSVASAAVTLTVLMVVMVALYIRVVAQGSGHQFFHRLVRVARNASVELDSGLCEGVLLSASDSSADKRVDALRLQKSCQRSVAASLCSDYLCLSNLSVLYLVYLKLLGMTEMLKDLTVFVSYCYFHDLLILL